MKKLLLVAGLLLALDSYLRAQKLQTDLTFIYWMSYDNNLTIWADSIYHMIDSGLDSDQIAVTIQKDVSGADGMTRSLVTGNSIEHEKIQEEKSYSGQVYFDYLKWVSKKVRSNKYFIIFLDHGGKLDEVGLDEYPEEKFLRIDSIAWAIEQFNALVGKKTELIYLQVCTKGSIEPLYQLRNASHFTLFSQTRLGAPNYYYETFFEQLSAEDKIANHNGLSISELFIKHERSDMYFSLIGVKNSGFPRFSENFNSFIDTSSGASEYQSYDNLLLFYYEQTYFDLKAFIKAFEDVDCTPLINSLNDLIVINQLNPDNEKMTKYCGISLLAPQKDYLSSIKKYNHLDFFQDFDMSKLYSTINTLRK